MARLPRSPRHQRGARACRARFSQQQDLGNAGRRCRTHHRRAAQSAIWTAHSTAWRWSRRPAASPLCCVSAYRRCPKPTSAPWPPAARHVPSPSFASPQQTHPDRGWMRSSRRASGMAELVRGHRRNNLSDYRAAHRTRGRSSGHRADPRPDGADAVADDDVIAGNLSRDQHLDRRPRCLAGLHRRHHRRTGRRAQAGRRCRAPLTAGRPLRP